MLCCLVGLLGLLAQRLGHARPARLPGLRCPGHTYYHPFTFTGKSRENKAGEKHHSGKSTTMVIDQMGFNLYCCTKDCQFLVSLSKCTEMLDSMQYICTFSQCSFFKSDFKAQFSLQFYSPIKLYFFLKNRLSIIKITLDLLKNLNLQVHLHKTFFSDNGFLDLAHNSFLHQT